MNSGYIVIPLVLAVGFLIFPFVMYYGSHIMVVTSDSMLPALKPHDLIIVERTSADQIETGDIIAFDSHMQGIGIIAHRAIKVVDDHGEIGIDTQGDNTDGPDPWTVHDEDLIGVIIEVIPSIGIFLIEPIRYTLVAVIVITAIAYLKDYTSEVKKASHKKSKKSF